MVIVMYVLGNEKVGKLWVGFKMYLVWVISHKVLENVMVFFTERWTSGESFQIYFVTLLVVIHPPLLLPPAVTDTMLCCVSK